MNSYIIYYKQRDCIYRKNRRGELLVDEGCFKGKTQAEAENNFWDMVHAKGLRIEEIVEIVEGFYC